MREVSRSALVPYSPAQMFALVEDIERYPEFLPWVDKAELIERNGNEVIGRLEMHRAGVHEKFTTRNVLNPPREIVLTSGQWAVSHAGGPLDVRQHRGPRYASVTLSVRFEFANSVLALLLIAIVREELHGPDQCVRGARAQGLWSGLTRRGALSASSTRCLIVRRSWTSPRSRNERRGLPSNAPDLLKRFPEIATRPLACAIFGRAVALARKVRPGDRVEILRPLLIDPKEQRRQAAARGRARPKAQ